MRHRPLCLVFLVLIFLIVFFKILEIPFPGTPVFPEPVGRKLHDEGMRMTAQGTVRKKKQGTDSIQIFLEDVSLTGGYTSSLHGQLLVYCSGEYETIPCGARISCTGKTFFFQEEVNPGTFNAAAYYHSFGCYLYMDADRVEMREEPDSMFFENLYRLKQKMKDILYSVTDAETAGVLAGQLLSEKSGDTEEIRENFSALSLSHILTGYGFHIMLSGRLLYALALRLKFGRYGAFMFSAVQLWLYYLFLGDSPAVFRACVMFTCIAAAKTFIRSYDAAGAMSLAGIIILLKNPECLFYQGFLYSFSAAFGMAVIHPVLLKMHGMLKNGRRHTGSRRRLQESFLSRLFLWSAVNMAVLPVSLYFSFDFPVTGFLANLLFISLAGPSFLLSSLGLAAGFFSFSLSGVFLFLPVLLIRLENFLGNAAKSISWTVINTGRPSFPAILLYAAGVCFVLLLWNSDRIRRVRKKLKLGLFLLAVSVFFLTFRFPEPFYIAMLDVGQGACTVINIPDAGVYIFDAGSSSVSDVGRRRIVSYLKCMAVHEVDAILASHADIDHINGIADILESGISVNNLCVPGIIAGDSRIRILTNLAEQNGTAVKYLSAGDSISGEDFNFEILNPSRETGSRTDNENSMVVSLDYRGFTALLTADMENRSEREIIESGRSWFFLEVPHHGSRNSTSEEFLASVKPAVAFISAGRNSIYGHPHRETLERLDAAGVKWFVTNKGGMLEIIVQDSGKILIKTALKTE